MRGLQPNLISRELRFGRFTYCLSAKHVRSGSEAGGRGLQLDVRFAPTADRANRVSVSGSIEGDRLFGFDRDKIGRKVYVRRKFEPLKDRDIRIERAAEVLLQGGHRRCAPSLDEVTEDT